MKRLQALVPAQHREYNYHNGLLYSVDICAKKTWTTHWQNTLELNAQLTHSSSSKSSTVQRCVSHSISGVNICSILKWSSHLFKLYYLMWFSASKLAAKKVMLDNVGIHDPACVGYKLILSPACLMGKWSVLWDLYYRCTKCKR